MGTTNESEFLKDDTGGRRFWPVDLGKNAHTKSVFRDLEAEVPLIWAEAVELYRRGESLKMSDGAENLAKKSQEEHRESNYNEGLIEEFLNQKIPKDWYRKTVAERRAWLDNWFNQRSVPEEDLMQRDHICAVEIWNECFRQTGHSRMKKTDAREINGILDRLQGWQKMKNPMRFGSEYGMQRGYERTVT